MRGRFALLGAVLVASCVLAACGSSGSTKVAASTTPSTASSAAASPSAVMSAVSPAPPATGSGTFVAGGYTNPEIADAKAITGLVYTPEPDHNHVQGSIAYNTSPPVGGNHSQYWADCSGTVYPDAIASENAVHSLEHGAVWITYNPSLPADQVAILGKIVAGQDRMMMSPYPNLKTNISLQTWDYQLFLDSASDPRITAFIQALRFNPKTTPESQATCSQPTFIAHPSTSGHPLWVPATAA